MDGQITLHYAHLPFPHESNDTTYAHYAHFDKLAMDFVRVFVFKN
jgi:hypothetical protein